MKGWNQSIKSTGPISDWLWPLHSRKLYSAKDGCIQISYQTNLSSTPTKTQTVLQRLYVLLNSTYYERMEPKHDGLPALYQAGSGHDIRKLNSAKHESSQITDPTKRPQHPDQDPHNATKSICTSQCIILKDGIKSICLPTQQYQSSSGHYILNYI
jgi:hypothetical protein